MKKNLFYLLVINICFALPGHVFAQGTVDTGRESAKGELDFSARAAYELLHPPTFHTMELENDEDEPTPLRPPVDPLQIHYRIPGTYTTFIPLSLLPVSPAPTDTFESTLDNGSAIPPDTHGAVDSNYCVTTINTAVHIQTRAGANVSSVSLDGFWTSVLPGGGAFDPRIHYDPHYHRWICVTDANGQLASSALLIAVSKTSNPTGGWWTYIVPIAAPGYWLDYPDVGFNQKWVVISGNLFGLSSGYGGCKVYAFNYASLMSGAGAPFTAFTQSSSQCICPTQTYDPTLQSIFAIESWDGSAGGGGQMRLWKISGAVGSETMTHVAYPASAGYNWQGQGNGGSDFAPQTGTGGLIQTNDDRVFSSVYINGKVWCSHNVFSPSSGPTTRCSAQWWQVDTFGTPVQIGLVDDPTNANFFSFPSIAVNSSDDALIGFTQFSASTHPDAAYAVHMHTDPADSVRPYVVYRHGQATYFKNFGGSRDRWGDYSSAVVDPLTMTDFWTIQEASASPANTWDTWWAYVNMCNIVATITPAGPTTFCAGGSVVLNATSGVGYTYQWKSGGSAIVGATNSSYTASSTGNYTVVITNGCSATSPATAVSVNPLPAAITGNLNVCVGGTSNLTDASGTWTSGTTTVATIGSSSGVVSGSTPGTSLITFTLPTGCATTATVTVHALPVASVTAGGPTTFCSGGSVTLNATTGAGYNYQWQVGGSNIGGATNSSYVASAGGNYGVVVTDANGCSSTSGTTLITVNPSPTAITGTATVCSGFTTTLNSTPAGGAWSTANPAVATVSGLGVVTGAGTGGLTNISYTLGTGCYATVVVTVNSATAAPITGPSSVCVGQTISLGDVTPSGTWSSTNPLVATVSSSGVVTGFASGVVTISYVAATSCGTGTATLPVTVNVTPTVASITGSTVVCAGGTTLLSDVTPAGVWVSNNTSIATVGSTSGLVTGASIGSTSIKYTVTNAFGCSAVAVTTLNVFAPFTATITPAGPTTFCFGGSVALNALTGAGYIYQWDKNGTVISGATGSTYTASATGNYTVLISIASGCNSLSSAVAVSVNPSPIVVPSVNVTASPGFQMCITPAPITFTATPAHGGTAPTYQWYVGAAPVGTGATYTYTPAVGDVVTCVLTSNDPCAFPVTASQAHTITMLSSLLVPSVSIIAHNMAGAEVTISCAGDTTKFSAVPVNGGPSPTYVWTKNGVNVATGPDYFYIPTSGDHLVCTMTSDANCVSPTVVSSMTYPVTVVNHVTNSVTISVSQSSIASGSVDTFTATAINGGSSPSFQWLKNGVIISGATTSRYITSTLANGDVISCLETSDAPCAAPATVISGGIRVVVNSVGVVQMTNAGNITLLPNPNKGEFTIDGNIDAIVDENVSISITDMLGQNVYTKQTPVHNGHINETVVLNNSVASGIYLVCITSTAGRAVYHVVISR